MQPHYQQHDDLLTPSLQQAEQHWTGERPWRLGTQFWIAFFGGIIPAMVIAYENGQRLGLKQAQLRKILLIGFVGLLVAIALDYALITATNVPVSRGGSLTREAGRAVGILGFAIFYQIQKGANRVYQLVSDGNYSSLWRHGFVVTLGLGLLQNLLVWTIVAMLRHALGS